MVEVSMIEKWHTGLKSQAAAVADLMFDSFPEFYSLFFKRNEDAFVNATQEQLENQYSEIGNTYCYVKEGDVIGVVSFFNSAELFKRQLISYRSIMKYASRPVDDARLAEFKKGIPPIQSPCFYLSRIAVDEKSRGLHIGAQLLGKYEAEASAAQADRLAFYVKADNTQALGFYAKQGYRTVTSVGSHVLVEKNGD